VSRKEKRNSPLTYKFAKRPIDFPHGKPFSASQSGSFRQNFRATGNYSTFGMGQDGNI
jgi:hypothetical protein